MEHKKEVLKVHKSESGQKLLNFLQRRIELSKNEAYKWIRTGQVRINSKRADPHARLEENDEIRIPPFAFERLLILKEQEEIEKKIEKDFDLEEIKIFENTDMLIIDKPHGIAVQAGSHINISIVDILKKQYATSLFMPTPAHRLDKDTSGLLIIAKSYNFLKKIHEEFTNKENSSLKKIYQAQIPYKEIFQFDQVNLWEDYLSMEKNEKGFEKVCSSNKEKGQYALSKVELIQHNKNLALIEIDLITGRKHQLRAQANIRNIPLLGDRKYGGIEADRLYLHAYKIILDKEEFISLPKWKHYYEE